MSVQPVVTKENCRANLLALWSLAELVSEAPLADMLAAAERAAAADAVFDPTLYRQKIQALSEDIEMLRAMLHVQTTLESITRRRASR